MTEKEFEKDKPLPEDTPKPPPETPNSAPLKNWADRVAEELVRGLNKKVMEEDGDERAGIPTSNQQESEE
jgi:hypothetical protein